MAYTVEASRGNKKFVTSVLMALHSNDPFLFAELFSKNGDQKAYKAPSADIPKGTDFLLLSELISNIHKLSEENVQTLIAAMPQMGTLSTATRLSVYLATYPHLDSKVRETYFGANSSLSFENEIASFADQHKQDLVSNTSMSRLIRRLYLDSVVKNQSPDDFASKFNLIRKTGISSYIGTNRLDYKKDGEYDTERYSQILQSLGREDAAELIKDFPQAFLCYDNINNYGPKVFSDVAGGRFIKNKKMGDSLFDAFINDDTEFLEKVSPEVILHATQVEIKKLTSSMLSSVDVAKMSPSQQEFIEKLDETLNEKAISEFARNVAGNYFHGTVGAAQALISMIITGNKSMVEKHIAAIPYDSTKFLSAALAEIDFVMPNLIGSGVIGEAQKDILLYLHDTVAQGLIRMRENVQGIDTSNAYRIKEQFEDRLVSVPLSELSAEQRDRWASSPNERRAPNFLSDLIHGAHRRSRNHDGFEPSR